MAELQENLRACYSAAASSPGAVAGGAEEGKFQSMKRLPELRARNRQYPALTEKVDVVPMGGRLLRGEF